MKKRRLLSLFIIMFFMTSIISIITQNAKIVSMAAEPQPAAPTNPVVDKVGMTLGWTNVDGFSNFTDYEYRQGYSYVYKPCTGNPQKLDVISGDSWVWVRVKANAAIGRPAGIPMAIHIDMRDFWMILSPYNYDCSSQEVAKYIDGNYSATTSINGTAHLEFSFTKINDKYYYKYGFGNVIDPSYLRPYYEFTPALPSKIGLDIILNDLWKSNDQVGIDVDIYNDTGLPVDIICRDGGNKINYNHDISVEAISGTITFNDEPIQSGLWKLGGIPSVSSITINPNEVYLKKGEQITLQATVMPENAVDKSVKWASGDESIAKVDATNGTLTALGEGTVTITATSNSNQNIKASIEVHVEQGVPVSDVIMLTKELYLKKGEVHILEPFVLPANADDKSLTWTSGNTNVATVDKDTGKVTAVSPGATLITATSNMDKSKVGTCTVRVPYDITDLQYAAFSLASYNNFSTDDIGKSIKAISMADRSSKLWESGTVMRGDLYATTIDDWILEDFINDDGLGQTGFVGAVFKHPLTHQLVVAYAGTETASFFKWWEDFRKADEPMALQMITDQFKVAWGMYLRNLGSGAPITLTGHSLGGALAQYVSYKTGNKAVTFNAASVTKGIYATEYETINFQGIDKLNVTDHVNEWDSVGNIGDDIDRTIVHESNRGFHDGIESDHGIQTILTLDENGKIIFTPEKERLETPQDSTWNYGKISLGTSVGDTIQSPGYTLLPSGVIPQNRIYGGDGNDFLYGRKLSNASDILIGGEGIDHMMGGAGNDVYVFGSYGEQDFASDEAGNDTYVIEKGCGTVTIDDLIGSNTIKFKGSITKHDVAVTLSKETGRLEIRIAGTNDVVYMYQPKSGSIDLKFPDGSKTNIYSQWTGFNPKIVIIHCPVNVEIYTKQGELVSRITDDGATNQETDYGYFYSIPGENGEVSKVAYLYDDNLDIRIKGTGAGTMDYTIEDIDYSGNPFESITYNDVPITPNTIISTDAEASKKEIKVDNNGDGNFDSKYSPSEVVDIPLPASTLSITGEVTSKPNAEGWFNSDVTVHYNASDSKYLIDYVTPNSVISTEGKDISHRGFAINENGDNATVLVKGINVDKTVPNVQVSGLSNGTKIILGSKVSVNWNATDTGSGLSTASSGSINLDTSTPGKHTITISATDKADNKTDLQLTYYVVYQYSGVLQPINTDGSSIFKAGSTIPVKFNLTDANNKYISTAVGKLYVSKVGDNGEAAAVSLGANSGNQFRYDYTNNQYIFNLSTKNMNLAQGMYQIRIELDDGESYYVKFSLK